MPLIYFQLTSSGHFRLAPESDPHAVVRGPVIFTQAQGNRLTLDAAYVVLCASARRHLETMRPRSDFTDYIGRILAGQTLLHVPMNSYIAESLRSAGRAEEETVRRAMRGEPDTRPRAWFIPQEIEIEADQWEPEPLYRSELMPYHPAPQAWQPISGMRTIFHPHGRFRAPDGRRFDYVCPELRRDPALPRRVLPTLHRLVEGVQPGTGAKFVGRHADPDYDRTQIGSQPRWVPVTPAHWHDCPDGRRRMIPASPRPAPRDSPAWGFIST